MVVKCNDIVIAIVIIEQGGIRSGISDAPVDMEHNNNRDHRGISVSPHITPTYSHNHIFPHVFTYDGVDLSIHNGIQKHPTKSSGCISIAGVSRIGKGTCQH